MGGHGSGTNPNSHKNLNSRSKGGKGNAAARGAILLSKAYRNKLGEIDPDDAMGRTFAEVIAETMVLLAARNKSIKAATEIADRVEGRPAQSLSLDATVTQTTPERVAEILQALSVLKSDGDAKFSIN
jgi:hypothetical protein